MSETVIRRDENLQNLLRIGSCGEHWASSYRTSVNECQRRELEEIKKMTNLTKTYKR